MKGFALQNAEPSPQEICTLLEASLVPNGEVQKRVLQAMHQLRKMPGFTVALVSVFESDAAELHIRQSAGICLKNQLKAGAAIDELALCGRVMKMLGHPAKILRHTAGSILACLLKRRLDLAVLGGVFENLYVDNADVLEGSLWALSLTCEDLLAQDVDEAFVQICCCKLLPRAMELTEDRVPTWLRKQASDFLALFVVQGAFDPDKWPAGAGLQARFLQTLGSLAMSADTGLVRNACMGFCSVIEQRWAALTPEHVSMILNFMLGACQHAEDDVRREALAVWRLASESVALHPLLEERLPQLTPILMANLTLGPADMLALDAGALDEDNADQEDGLEEIQPQFHKEGRFSEEEAPKTSPASSASWGEEWTARMVAGDALETLAGPHGSHGGQVCRCILPLINEKLQATCWKQQEAGIMALGLVASSCMQIVPEYLQAIVQLLLRLLSSPQPLVRSMACMSLTQFLPGCSDLVSAVVPAILERCKDRNKQVQRAAIVSLAAILHVDTIMPFMHPICETLKVGMETYKTKSLCKLYQCIGIAVQIAPDHMTSSGLPVLVALFQRFLRVQAGDPTAMSLFESMAAVVNNLARFLTQEHALPSLVDKAVQVINETASAVQIWRQNPEEFEQPDQDLMAAAVDLLASMIYGLQGEVVGLLRTNNFLYTLPLALGACSMRTREAGFWLLGSAAEHSKDQVIPLLPHILDLLVAGLQHSASTAVNWAAAWALGELCQRTEPRILEPVIPQIGNAFLAIFQRRIGVDVLPGHLHAHRQLLSATCFTLMCLKHTSTLGDKWPSLACQIPADTVLHLESQYGYGN